MGLSTCLLGGCLVCFLLDLPLFWDCGKLPSFLASCHLLVIVFANSAMGCIIAGIAFRDILLLS